MARFSSDRRDLQAELRGAAIAHVLELERRFGILHWRQIANGFVFRGHKILLANRPRGIFQPRVLTTGALSIRTSVPRQGRSRRYDDQIASAEPHFRYAYQGTDPAAPDNVALRKCLQSNLPVIYFYGVSEAAYRPLICKVVGEDRVAKVFHIAPTGSSLAAAVAESDDSIAPPTNERRYSMAEVRRRLHQDKFREAVIAAYEGRCSICRLRHPELLDAAHIIPDRERMGEAKVPNGLSMCKLHHAAFDSYLLGVRPDRVVVLRQDLLEEKDGPMLEHGFRSFNEMPLVLPRARADWPDPSLLEERWKRFAA